MSHKLIYDVPKSGWTSPDWNWGSAMGTGHDCAAICRSAHRTRKARAVLVQELQDAPDIPPRDRRPANFEEVKLTMALAWQNGRWQGLNGGPGGYDEVLTMMAEASRYEIGDEEKCSINLIEDLQSRFHLLDPPTKKAEMMSSLLDGNTRDTDAARRRASGLVLEAMGFVETG